MALKRKPVFLCLLLLSPACSGLNCQTHEVFRVEEGEQLSLTCTVALGRGKRVMWKRSLNGNSKILGFCGYKFHWSCHSSKPYELDVQERTMAALTISGNLLSNIAGTVMCEQGEWRDLTFVKGHVGSCNIQVQYPAAKIRNCQAQRDTDDTVSGSCDVDKLYSSDLLYGCWWKHLDNDQKVWNSKSYTQSMGDGKLQCRFYGYPLSGVLNAANFSLAIGLEFAWYTSVPIHFGTGSTTKPPTERGSTTKPAVITGTTSYIPWTPTTPSTTNGDERDGSTPTALIAGVISVTLLVIVIVVIAVIVVMVKRRKGSQKVADSVEYVNDLRVSTVEFNPAHPLPSPSRGPDLPTNQNASAVPRDVDDLNLQSQPGTSRDLSIGQDVDTGLYSSVDGEDKASPPQAQSPEPQVGDVYAVVMKPRRGGNSQPNNNSNNQPLNQPPTPNLSPTPDPDEAKGGNCLAEETYAQVQKKKKTKKKKKENSQGSNLAVLKEAEGEGQLYAQVKKPKRGAVKSTDEGVPGKPVSSDPGMSDVRTRTEGRGADYENVTPQGQGRPSNEGTSTADAHDVYNALNFHRPPPPMDSSDDPETQYSHIGAVNNTG